MGTLIVRTDKEIFELLQLTDVEQVTIKKILKKQTFVEDIENATDRRLFISYLYATSQCDCFDCNNFREETKDYPKWLQALGRRIGNDLKDAIGDDVSLFELKEEHLDLLIDTLVKTIKPFLKRVIEDKKHS